MAERQQNGRSESGSSSLPSDEPKKRRGRPPGSGKREEPTVVVLPFACDKCGSTERKVVKVIAQRAIKGEIRGVKFNWVTWRRVQCECGQYSVTRTYRMIARQID